MLPLPSSVIGPIPVLPVPMYEKGQIIKIGHQVKGLGKSGRIIRLCECDGFHANIILSTHARDIGDITEPYIYSNDKYVTYDPVKMINKKDLVLYTYIPYKTTRYLELLESCNE
jgi:hypothetical protein